MFDDNLLVYILRIPALLISLTIHELSHGYVAYRLGDITAKSQGRLSLNPFRHLDPIGTIMMVVVGFGWAKPVPVNPLYFRDKKKGMMLVSVAGPLSNILLAFITVLVFYITTAIVGAVYSGVQTPALYLLIFLQLLFYMNLSLAVFNLIPVPPLDGSKILSAVLPTEKYFHLMRYERYIGLVFLAVMFFFPTALSGIIGFFTRPIASSMEWAARSFVGIFVR